MKNVNSSRRVWLRNALLVFVLFVAASAWAKTPVSNSKVVQDMRKFYADSGFKANLLDVTYVGNVRHFTRMEGLVEVPYHSHEVAFDAEDTRCGLKIRYLYEAHYRKPAGSWLFSNAATLSHEVLVEPTGGQPEVDEAVFIERLRQTHEFSGDRVVVDAVEMQRKDFRWNFCLGEYELGAEVKVTWQEGNERTHFVCNVEGRLSQREVGVTDDWNLTGLVCVHGDERAACYFSKTCREAGASVGVAAPSPEQALEVLRPALAAVEESVSVESLEFVSAGPMTSDAHPLAPYVLRARLTRREFDSEDKKEGTNVYDCHVHTKLSWDGAQWLSRRGFNCCRGPEKCSEPCHNPRRGCERVERRLDPVDVVPAKSTPKKPSLPKVPGRGRFGR